VYMHSVSFVKASQLSKGVAKAQKAWVRPLKPAPLPLFTSLLEEDFSETQPLTYSFGRQIVTSPPFTHFSV
jgi:hypothetical protein